MYQNMAHTLYCIPFHIRMSITILLSEHINSFANDFHVFDKTIKNYGI